MNTVCNKKHCDHKPIDFRKVFSEENVQIYRTWSKLQEEFWKNVHTPRGEEIKNLPEFTIKPYPL